MLIIEDLQGNIEGLTGYKDLTRQRRVNGDRSLKFRVMKTDDNAHSFGMADEESIITLDDDLYRIKRVVETTKGARLVRTVDAEAKFIGDLVDVFQYDTITGYLSINDCMTHALKGSGYTYTVIDSYNQRQIENFGNDTALSLINKVLTSFSCEMEVDDISKVVTIRKKVSRTTDAQFRYKYNLKAIAKDTNTENLSTYIKGFGKKNDDGTYVVTAEYTSPNATAFPSDSPDGLRHSPPLYDDRFTDYNSLLDALKEAIIDEPEVSFTVDLVQLRDGGLEGVVREGDEIFVIHEPLGIDLTARVMEVEDYPFTSKSPKFTLSNYRNNVADTIANSSKGIGDITAGRVPIRTDMLDIALKAAIEALKSAQTELVFDNGILAIDKEDANNVVIFNSAGLGVSTDGGNTVRSAITRGGIATELLTAGQIDANNIRVIGGTDDDYALIDETGFTAKGTAYTVIRPDGYRSVDNGIPQNDFVIMGAQPPFTASNVSITGYFWDTTSDTPTDCQYFSFKHDSRYLKIHCGIYAGDAGSGAAFSFHANGGDILAQRITYETDPTLALGDGEIITIDLGIPTGETIGIYARLRTGSVGGYHAYARIIRMWKEG